MKGSSQTRAIALTQSIHLQELSVCELKQEAQAQLFLLNPQGHVSLILRARGASFS